MAGLDDQETGAPDLLLDLSMMGAALRGDIRAYMTHEVIQCSSEEADNLTADAIHVLNEFLSEWEQLDIKVKGVAELLSHNYLGGLIGSGLIDSLSPVPRVQSTHTVVSGDTLEDIAEEYLDDRNRWREIYNLNKGIITDPNLIEIGWVLTLPTGTTKPTTPPRQPESEPLGPGVGSTSSADKPPFVQHYERIFGRLNPANVHGRLWMRKAPEGYVTYRGYDEKDRSMWGIRGHCTDYVGWRLFTKDHIDTRDLGKKGNAEEWDNIFSDYNVVDEDKGRWWQQVEEYPAGVVAQWDWNHVAYVEQVIRNPTTGEVSAIIISEMNVDDDGSRENSKYADREWVVSSQRLKRGHKPESAIYPDSYVYPNVGAFAIRRIERGDPRWPDNLLDFGAST